MKNDSSSKPQKKYLKNSKKRKLDLRCLESNRFGVVSSTDATFPGHAVKLSSALQQLSQAGADLKRVCPGVAFGEVIVELPARCKLKFVIPAMDQGALDVEGDFGSSKIPIYDENQASKVTSEEAPTTRGRHSLTIEETALAEARRIAEAASRISMAAVDVGNQLVDAAEKKNLALEDAVEKLAESPDEKISRNSYGRAGGQEKTIRYSALGERTIGGNHIVVADLLSTDTFSLHGCKLTQGKRKGSYRLEGQPDDPEWIRLKQLDLDEFDLFDLKETPAMELLGYALTSNHIVDVDVCLAEKVSKKQRRLAPLKIRNSSNIIARTRDRLELLEENEAG
jgi:hypothetical protein